MNEHYLSNEDYRGIINFLNVKTTIIGRKITNDDIKVNRFKNIRYVNCNFSAVTFEKIYFEDVIFDECSFTFCSFNDCIIKPDSNLHILDSIINYSNFNNCILENIFFNLTYLKNTRFNHVGLRTSNFYRCCFVKVLFNDGCNLSKTNIIRTLSCLDIEFDNSDRLNKFDNLTKIVLFDHKDDYIFAKYSNPLIADTVNGLISNTYNNFAIQYKLNHNEKMYGECFYNSKKTSQKELKGLKKFKSIIAFACCGFGERWYFGLITMIIILLSFAQIYLFTGLVKAETVIKYEVSGSYFSIMFNEDVIESYINSLYFSIMTFTTVGYGNIEALGISSIIFSSIEMLLGVFLIAVMTASMVRKVFRQ